MPKAKKTIKEVQLKFSPKFEKAINSTGRKAKVVKPKTKLVAPRGYKLREVNKILNIAGESKEHTLIELTGRKMNGARLFINTEAALKAISEMEQVSTEGKALAGKTYGGQLARGIMKETAELAAASELPELVTDVPDDRSRTRNTEDTDK